MGVTNIPKTIFDRPQKVVYNTHNGKIAAEQVGRSRNRVISMLPCRSRTSGDLFDTTFSHSSYRKDLHVSFLLVVLGLVISAKLCLFYHTATETSGE
jgi:hypothetical protein